MTRERVQTCYLDRAAWSDVEEFFRSRYADVTPADFGIEVREQGAESGLETALLMVQRRVNGIECVALAGDVTVAGVDSGRVANEASRPSPVGHESD